MTQFGSDSLSVIDQSANGLFTVSAQRGQLLQAFLSPSNQIVGQYGTLQVSFFTSNPVPFGSQVQINAPKWNP